MQWGGTVGWVSEAEQIGRTESRRGCGVEVGRLAVESSRR